MGERAGWRLVTHRHQPIGRAFRLYGLRLAKSGAGVAQLANALAGRQFSEDAVSPIWDSIPTTTRFKVIAALWYAVLRLTSRDVAGLSQYAVFDSIPE